MRTTRMLGGLTTMAAAAVFLAPGCAVTMDGAVSSYTSALCERMFACSPWMSQTAFKDQGACESAYRPLMEETLVLPDIAFDAEQLQSCADALRSASCDDYPFVATTHPACDLKGTRPQGSACSSPVQCESGYCKGYSSTKCGACAPTRAAGETCAEDVLACEHGTFCAGDGKCGSLPVKEGDACVWICGSGLRCHENVCVAVPAEGAACASLVDCDFANGFTCDPKTMKCAEIKIAALGEACAGSLATCSGDGYCDGGVCVPRAKLGEACISAGNNNCAVTLNCVDGVCAEISFPTCE